MQPLPQGDRFELDHGYPLDDQAADHRRLQVLMEQMQFPAESSGGATYLSVARKQALKREFIAVTRRLDPTADPAVVAKSAEVLLDDSMRQRADTESLDQIEATMEVYDQLGTTRVVTGLEALPPALVSPGPEAAIDDSDLLRLDVVSADAIRDRRTNFLYDELFVNQSHFLGRCVARPFATVHTFAPWMVTRALLVGIQRVPGTRQRLADFYPHIPVDVDALRAFTSADSDGPGLAEKDPETLCSRLSAVAPGWSELVGAMTETYCDMVRASRLRRDRPILTGLPELHQPRAGAEGLAHYAQRIRNVYRVLRDVRMTGLAFGVDPAALSPLLAALPLPPVRRPRRGQRGSRGRQRSSRY